MLDLDAITDRARRALASPSGPTDYRVLTQDVPRLVDAVRAAMGLHRPYLAWFQAGMSHQEQRQECVTCKGHPWPCATSTALSASADPDVSQPVGD